MKKTLIIALFLITCSIIGKSQTSQGGESLQSITDRGQITNKIIQVTGSDVISSLGKGLTFNFVPSLNAGAIGAYDYPNAVPLPLVLQGNGGNVGIGTASPSSPLEIRKNGELLKLSDEGPNQETSMTYLNTSYGLWQTGVNATGGGSWWIYKSGYGYLMNFMSNGNVGIGTADPKGYKLAVNGKIRSQEVKVEAANWPDYVFAKSYQLPSLQETEKHIKENGHLPGIPSAAEVKSNGIDLGEMNAKLLQKIEELTLHLIEQDKINKEQNQMILELVKRIDTQKNK